MLTTFKPTFDTTKNLPFKCATNHGEDSLFKIFLTNYGVPLTTLSNYTWSGFYQAANGLSGIYFMAGGDVAYDSMSRTVNLTFRKDYDVGAPAYRIFLKGVNGDETVIPAVIEMVMAPNPDFVPADKKPVLDFSNYELWNAPWADLSDLYIVSVDLQQQIDNIHVDDLSNYMPLSGGDITGNVTIDGSLSVGSLDGYLPVTVEPPSPPDEGYYIADGNILVTGRVTTPNSIADNFILGDIEQPQGKIYHIDGNLVLSDLNGNNITLEDIAETRTNVDAIELLIPAAATSANQLADKDFVTDSITQGTAVFRGSFADTAAFNAVQWQTSDPTAPNYVTNNDYAIVLDDTTHDDECWRYIYVSGTGWTAQYKINEGPLTQAQLDALNSGATSAIIDSIADKADKTELGDYLPLSGGWMTGSVAMNNLTANSVYVPHTVNTRTYGPTSITYTGPDVDTELLLPDGNGTLATQEYVGEVLTGYVQSSRTVNGHQLTSDVTVTSADLGLSSETWTFTLSDDTVVTRNVCVFPL